MSLPVPSCNSFKPADSGSASRSQQKRLFSWEVLSASWARAGPRVFSPLPWVPSMAWVMLCDWTFNCLILTFDTRRWEQTRLTGCCLLSVCSHSRHLPGISLAIGIKASLLSMLYEALYGLASAHLTSSSPVILICWLRSFSKYQMHFCPRTFALAISSAWNKWQNEQDLTLHFKLLIVQWEADR